MCGLGERGGGVAELMLFVCGKRGRRGIGRGFWEKGEGVRSMFCDETLLQKEMSCVSYVSLRVPLMSILFVFGLANER